ncbi:phosphatase PAP2 family protein, partial [Gordonibacter pamelaeae]
MDIAILDLIQAHLRSPLMDALMLAATHLGDLALVWLAAGAVLAAQPRYRRYGAAVLLAVAATAVLGMLVLKPLFGRVRPFEAYGFMGLLVPPPAGNSFPSNHSMVSFAAAAALCGVPGR